jgi:hypothetical protein
LFYIARAAALSVGATIHRRALYRDKKAVDVYTRNNYYSGPSYSFSMWLSIIKGEKTLKNIKNSVIVYDH